MKLFTISSGTVTEGITVKMYKNEKFEMPIISVGGGSYDKESFMAVQLLPNALKELKQNGVVEILYGTLGVTKTGNPKLFQTRTDETPHTFFSKFSTMYGYRGSNSHTGDREYLQAENPVFLDFPGKILVTGTVSSSRAGNLGSGEHIIAEMPYNTVFRTAYSGRLYGSPGSHYYYFPKDEAPISVTWEERIISDCF